MEAGREQVGILIWDETPSSYENRTTPSRTVASWLITWLIEARDVK